MSWKNEKIGSWVSFPTLQNATPFWPWDNPADPASCSGVVVKDVANCWASTIGDAIAQKDIDLIFGTQDEALKFVSLKSRLADYLQGAGSAMNPWPNEPPQFYESDAEALVSDWDATVCDMYTVLKASDLISSKYGRLKHEQPIGRGESAAEAGKLERGRFKAGT
jgi:hypothetical protein